MHVLEFGAWNLEFFKLMIYSQLEFDCITMKYDEGFI